MTLPTALAEPTGNHRRVQLPARQPAEKVRRLVEQAQAGDADAFGQIYEYYFETIFRYIKFRVANQQTAEDLTADVFLRALKHIGSFTWRGRDFGAWLVTIARNRVADHFKSGRQRFENTGVDIRDSDTFGGLTEGPEGSVLSYLAHVDMLRAVRQLNAEQQECVVLRFLRGLSVAETAQIMGKNEGAIKALQYRARNALVRLLVSAPGAPVDRAHNDRVSRQEIAATVAPHAGHRNIRR
jgi:RNA polymerase sigma-70 factor (ECF subfamily)